MYPIPALNIRAIAWVLTITATIAVTAWLTHTVTASKYRAELDAMRVSHAQAMANAQAQARQAQETINQQYQEALNAATKREQNLRADVRSATAAAGSLRQQLAALSASASAEAAAGTCPHANATAATVADLLGACTSEYQSMAETADRHAQDALKLLEAWPRDPNAD